jgi:hypothetical protein
MSTIKALATTTAHFLDHPTTIRAAERFVPLVYWLGAPALLAKDVYQAEGIDNKKKVALRDTLVLGATLIGTVLGTRWLMKEDHEFAKRGIQALSELKGTYSVPLKEKLQTMLGKAEDLITFKDFRQNFWKLWGETSQALGKASSAEEKAVLLEKFEADRHALFPLGEAEEESLKEQISKATSFFTVGLMSVIGGAVGGLLSNKMTDNDPQIKVNILKESAFQFIANIAMCAVGAIVGVTTVNQLSKHVNPVFNNRLFRIPIVGAGLSIGIAGGGYIANYLGKTLINPLCEWTDSANRTWQDLKERVAESRAKTGNSRKIEFSDIILHLDDLPTALAIAGMKVMGPFIPPFFAFSGYRAGIGYRNKHDESDAPQPVQFASPMVFGHPSQNLMATNSVFRTFYEHQRQSF